MLDTTLTAPKTGPATTSGSNARRTVFFIFSSGGSKRMGAVGADRELELKKGFVRGDPARVASTAQLSANLRELTRPEGQRHRLSTVPLRVVVGVVGELVPRPAEPASRQLVVPPDEETARRLLAIGLLASASKELAPQGERTVRSTRKRLPAVDEMNVLERRLRLFGRPVRSPNPGRAQFGVVVIAEVAVGAVLPQIGKIAARGRVEETFGLAAKDLKGQLGKSVAGEREAARYGHTRVAPPLLAAEEAADRQRLVGPRERVQMLGVDLPDLRLELPD